MVKRQRRHKVAKTLIYGIPKAGKTVFASTAAFDVRSAPALFLDTEGGLDSIDLPIIDIEVSNLAEMLDVNVELHEHEDGSVTQAEIPVVTIRSWEDYTDVQAFLETTEHPFKTIILDSITEANELFFLERLSVATEASGRRTDENVSEIQDFQVINNMIARVLRAFIHMKGIHVIFTAHDKQTQKHGRSFTMPKLTPSGLATTVAGMCNQVVYLDYDDAAGARSLLVQDYADMVLGGRYGMATYVPDEIIEPTFSDFLDVLDGIYEEDTDDGDE